MLFLPGNAAGRQEGGGVSEGGVTAGHTQGGVAAGGEHRVWPGVPCIVTTLAVTQHMQGESGPGPEPGPGPKKEGDFVEVSHFHNHNQCWRCCAVSGRDYVAR